LEAGRCDQLLEHAGLSTSRDTKCGRARVRKVHNFKDIFAQNILPSFLSTRISRGLAKVAGMLAADGKADGQTFLGEAGFRALHDQPTEGWTFGMHTFYTQGGVNFYKDGRVEKGDAVKAGRDGMIHYGQLVPRGLYGWGGYGGSVFLWDKEKQLGFVYIPTYLAWYDRKKERATNLLSTLYSCLGD